MNLPTEGTRICLSGHIGTVKFVGQVDNSPGVWLGVEWDDPHRGKHNGTKDGKVYFSTRHSKAGLFIRPSANIIYGTDFLHALTSKYIELPHGGQTPEQVILGSSNGAIVVEAVGLDKIRGKLANLGKLREVSLDSESVARSNAPGTIQATCPNIRGLDLSRSLIPSWDVITLITTELVSLERLAVNRNRFRPPVDSVLKKSAFKQLVELQLNDTAITWQDIQLMIAAMPKLQSLEVGYNGLTQLEAPIDCSGGHDGIKSINFDSNVLADWTGLWDSLRHYKSLQRLVLTSNTIDVISFPVDVKQRFFCLKQLFLSHNRLNAWMDIDALAAWCPVLETLTLSGNPLRDREVAHSRPFIISKIPSLITLDGAIITTRERVESELFYQSYIVRQEPGSEEQRVKAHPQWLRLRKKHGSPESHIQADSVTSEKLSQKLIDVMLYQAMTPSPMTFHSLITASQPIKIKVLSSMKLKVFRLKIAKVTKHFKSQVSLWLKQQQEQFVPLSEDIDHKDLEWLGVGDKSDIIFYIHMMDTFV